MCDFLFVIFTISQNNIPFNHLTALIDWSAVYNLFWQAFVPLVSHPHSIYVPDPTHTFCSSAYVPTPPIPGSYSPGPSPCSGWMKVILLFVLFHPCSRECFVFVFLFWIVTHKTHVLNSKALVIFKLQDVGFFSSKMNQNHFNALF